MHGRDVRIEAGADVLQIEDYGVDIGEHLWRRTLALSIEAGDREACLAVQAMPYVLASVDFPPQAVLWYEESLDLYSPSE